jgi:GT2 family glycosyltransferase
MKSARGDVVAYLNDDSEPFPDWTDGILQAFSEDPGAAAVGGPTVDKNPRQMETILIHAEHLRLIRAAVWSYNRIVMKGHFLDIGLLFQTGGYSIGGYFQSSTLLRNPRDVDQLTITNVAIRKEVLTALGGFDEGFYFNHADGDFFVRARAAGYRLVFHPRVSVYHHANAVGPVRNPRLLGRDTARFFLKTIEPRDWRDKLGWMANVAAFNLFWIYKTLESGRSEQVKGILGFIQGVALTIQERRN